MFKGQVTCHACKTEVEAKIVQEHGIYLPEKWVEAKVVVNRCGYYGGHDKTITYHFCSECAEKLGLVKPNDKSTGVQEKSYADRLFEIVQEIAQQEAYAAAQDAASRG
jgi:hypothetical protein